MSNPNIPNGELKFYSKEFEDAFDRVFKKTKKNKKIKKPSKKTDKSLL